MAEIPLLLGSTGMNNKVDPTDLSYDPKTGLIEMAYAVNIDIERPFRVMSRRGYTRRITIANAHSFFYEGGDFGLFAAGSYLYYILDGYSYGSLASLTSGFPVHYCKVGDDVFYSNGVEKGVITKDRTATTWGMVLGYDSPPDYTTTSRAFSLPPNGTLMAHHGGRLFLAVGDAVFFSEPFWYGYFDLESNYVQLNGGITMLGSVVDGLYISDSEHAYWCKAVGDGMYKPQKLPDGFGPVITGTMCRCDGKLVNDDYYGDGLIWVSKDRVCWGGPGGFYMDLSYDKFRFPDAKTGAAMLYDKKYIFVLNQ